MKSSYETPVAFQLYAGDWLSNRTLRLMPKDAKADLVDFLCHIWLDKDCRIPYNPQEMARLLGVELAVFVDNWTRYYQEFIQIVMDENHKSFYACGQLTQQRAKKKAFSASQRAKAFKRHLKIQGSTGALPVKGTADGKRKKKNEIETHQEEEAFSVIKGEILPADYVEPDPHDVMPF